MNSAAAGLVEVRVPDMGNFKDVAIIDVLVKPGEQIELETPLVTLETEKATMDVPSTVGGVVEKIHISKGGTVCSGDLVVTVLAAPMSEVKSPSALTNQSTPTAAPLALLESSGRNHPPPIVEPESSRVHAGPAVRRLARELDVDLTKVSGSGFRGRLTQDDIKSFVKGHSAQGAAPAAVRLPAVPVIDFSQFGEIQIRPLTRIQRISGTRLHASWVNIPHVTQFDEADITELEAARTRLQENALRAGIKLTPLSFILRACVKVLREYPIFNASLDPTGANVVLKKYIHIGFATDTPNGLLVPVVRNADQKDIYEIAQELRDLTNRAREGKLTPAQMEGGSFTVSSLGGVGGTAFTPIINAPEVAILGVSRSAMRPVFRDGVLAPRLILPFSLSYDHRVIDGAAAARFTTYLSQTLADPLALTQAVA